MTTAGTATPAPAAAAAAAAPPTPAATPAAAAPAPAPTPVAPTPALPAHLAEHEDDAYGDQKGYVKGTDYALPYYSHFSRFHDGQVRNGLWRNLNCGLLSTPGLPPTLLALKQHAQSLCILIQTLVPQFESREVGTQAANPTTTTTTTTTATGAAGSSSTRRRRSSARRQSAAAAGLGYELGDAFDFLMDLTTPYQNDDPAHNLPLTALVNDIRERDETRGRVYYHCPFADRYPREAGEEQKPYATHQNLIIHANDCLERLDHEFSSTGGLMSLLPSDEVLERQQLINSKNSLLGQWLLHHQLLTARLHDLERAYANALDALKGEATIPHQFVTDLGHDGRNHGRDLVYPQDRFVLVNCGDDVAEFIHNTLDKEEALSQQRDEVLFRNGAIGQRMRTEDGAFRSLVSADFNTRYYRLVGQERSTIFISPAWEHHPAVEHTKQIQNEPTIVAAIKPTWPPRATELEKKFKAYEDKAAANAVEVVRLRDDKHRHEEQLKSLRNHVDKLLEKQRDLENAMGSGEVALANQLTALKNQTKVLEEKIAALEPALTEERKRAGNLEGHIEEVERYRKEVEQELEWYKTHFPSAETSLLTALLTFTLTAPVLAQVPYIPTTILLPPSGSSNPPSSAFVLSPSSSSPSSLHLFTLNLTSPSVPSVLSTHPFPFSPENTAFTPAILPNGTLAIFSGANPCSSSSSSSSSSSPPSPAVLWTWSDASNSWTQHSTAIDETSDYAQTVPYHLGGAVSFSLQLSPVISPSTIYVYGGMCPSSSSSESSWQANAQYSNHMLRLSPPSSENNQKDTWAIASLTQTGGEAPIAEAGFTFTELTPSISNRSGIVTQQNGFVLLGGHTKEAFINMSTAAVWSLPEEGWSFVGIKPAVSLGGQQKPDLARGSEATEVGKEVKIDSRSGHSAVLSEDGTKIVVYGGWVGDTSQAAEPQLAVIKVGVGLGDWGWEVPAVANGGGGRYGHGAVLLPGNVMMVYGGVEISGKTTTNIQKRQDAGEGKMMFLNITSMTWSDKYDYPVSSGPGGTNNHGGKGGNGSANGGAVGGGGQNGSKEGDNDDDDDAAKKKRKISMGVGLGVGLLFFFLLSAVMGYFCVWKKRQQRRRRASREDALTKLAQGMNGSLPRGITEEDDDMLEKDHGMMFPWNAASARDWYTGGDDPYSQGRRSLAYEGLRHGGLRNGGASLYMPPPPGSSSGGGRPRNAARGLYQPTTSVTAYDFSPLGKGRMGIEPIWEADEEYEDAGDLGRQKQQIARPSPGRGEDSDPFMTPTGGTPRGEMFPAGSQSPEKSPVQMQDPEVQGWKSDVDKADAVLAARIGRHGSTTTTPSRFAGRTSPTRNPSFKVSVTGGGGNGQDSPTGSGFLDDARTESNLSEASAFSFVPGQEPQRLRAVAAGEQRAGSSSGSSTGGTFSTARSSFPVLQAEGPGLLLGQQTAYVLEDDEYQKEEEDAEYVYVPGSPSKTKPRRSWFGSIRRVFDRGTPETGSSREDSPTRESLLEAGGTTDYERTGGVGGSSGTLQRRKQGKEAWVAEGGSEEDWDIERAVEQRLVQVMFTVPKERLRVVNAEIEHDEVEQAAVVVNPDDEDYYSTTTSGDQAAGSKDPEGTSSESAGLRPPEPVHQSSGGGSKSGSTRSRESMSNGLEPPPPGAGGISPSASLRAVSITASTLHTAEAVRLERPRTRVLEMVESIESKSSRDASPAGSPAPSLRQKKSSDNGY
ncbi:hypothetical protein QBC35DRAFT_373488 [Podospora australis]|uniref:Uncharacterized protein n=1 Tax=Podospora australis TaxID=1536484 RepID=A0AAN7AMQ8_9PEZI|nr:hypothetical protein QBC35DRAFT_373488 [Podospora australis]